MSAMTEGVPRVHSASITLLSPEANLHGHLAHAAHISSKARCLRHAIKT